VFLSLLGIPLSTTHTITGAIVESGRYDDCRQCAGELPGTSSGPGSLPSLVRRFSERCWNSLSVPFFQVSRLSLFGFRLSGGFGSETIQAMLEACMPLLIFLRRHATGAICLLQPNQSFARKRSGFLRHRRMMLIIDRQLFIGFQAFDRIAEEFSQSEFESSKLRPRLASNASSLELPAPRPWAGLHPGPVDKPAPPRNVSAPLQHS